MRLAQRRSVSSWDLIQQTCWGTNKLGLNATIIFEVVNLKRDLRSTSTTSPSQDKWASTLGASKAKFQPSLESMIFSWICSPKFQPSQSTLTIASWTTATTFFRSSPLPIRVEINFIVMLNLRCLHINVNTIKISCRVKSNSYSPEIYVNSSETKDTQ